MLTLKDKYQFHLYLGVCKVVFTKENGESREMICTLQQHQIPIDQQPLGKRLVPENQVNVWDMEKKAWRSFRTDSVTKFFVQFHGSHNLTYTEVNF